METKHTPLPWRKAGQTQDIGHPEIAIVSSTGLLVALARAATGPYAQAIANARFIVQAVNSHSALTTALDACVEALEAAQDFDEMPDDLAAWARFKDLTKAALGTAKKARGK